MNGWFARLTVLAATLLACGGSSGGGGGGGGSGGTECARNPSGQVCQGCLQSARMGCVSNGVCADAYNTLEACNVRIAQDGCTDANGNPATGCCNGPSQTLLNCLDAMCPAWNAC